MSRSGTNSFTMSSVSSAVTLSLRRGYLLTRHVISTHLRQQRLADIARVARRVAVALARLQGDIREGRDTSRTVHDRSRAAGHTTHEDATTSDD